MNRAATVGVISLSILAVAATVDSALGLGGAEWLADLCFGDDTDMADMDMTPREGQPLPLIVLSLGISVAALGYLSREQAKSLSGRAAPDATDQSAILSAMLLVAQRLGKTSRSEIMGFYRIVTHRELEPQIIDLVMERVDQQRDAAMVDPSSLPRLEGTLGRRRTVAAAILMARKPEAATDDIDALLGAITRQVGATEEDVAAVCAALDEWDADCREQIGVPLFSLLRDRPLQIRPA